jgi:uncharacterized protein
MAAEPVRFPSGDLELEGTLYSPGQPSASVVVVCHPHPLRGGDMRNNVVMAIVQGVLAAGSAALAFNFRGVGASQGTHDEGRGEHDDARAAVTYALGLDGVERVSLAGYSFGAGVAANVAATGSFDAVALVSLPTSYPELESRLHAYSGPLLLLVGDADHVSSAEKLGNIAEARKNATEFVCLPGVDHFWRGAEPLIEAHTSAFLAANLKLG